MLLLCLMIATQDLHKAQVSILETLRHATIARYSALMRPTGLESDVFKFHLRTLVKRGYVIKTPSGAYTLTAIGKEFANNLDKTKRTIQKQPKHSLLLVVNKPGRASDLFLVQRRLRQPHWGYWGFISGPVQWGVDAEVTAAKELRKQTGLSADFQTALFYRQKDYESETGKLLEDKLFYVMRAKAISGELSDTYPHGHSEWMTPSQLEGQTKHFETTRQVIEMLRAGTTYFSVEVERESADF